MGLRNGPCVPKGGFAAAKHPSKWRLGCKMEDLQGVEVSQPFRSCETGVLGCEMALVCQGTSSQLQKFSQRALGGYETISQREAIFAAAHFCCEILRAMLSPCFWAPLDSQLPSFTFFDIPPDFDHPKTYIKSKQIRIKALKSKLKHLNQNLKHVINKTKRYGLASL